MAFFDKLNILAATASNKANNAIESGKLNIRINAEEKNIAEFTNGLGELLLDKLDVGATFDDDLMALYGAIQSSREVIANARAELDVNKLVTESAVCGSCGTVLMEGAQFCHTCGTKVETPVEIIPTKAVCASCGAELPEGAKFCIECGFAVES